MQSQPNALPSFVQDALSKITDVDDKQHQSSSSPSSAVTRRVRQVSAGGNERTAGQEPVYMVGVRKRNMFVYKILQMYITRVLRARNDYAEIAAKTERRIGRGAIYLQLNCIADAVSATSSHIIMGVSTGEAEALGYPPLCSFIKTYDPAREFIFCVGIIGDAEQRGWFTCAAINRHGKVSLSAPNLPDSVYDYDPLYVETYNNAMLDAKDQQRNLAEANDGGGGDDGQAREEPLPDKRDTEIFTRQRLLELQVVEELLGAVPGSRDLFTWQSQDIWERDVVRAGNEAHPAIDRLRLDMYMQTLAGQKTLFNCSREPCAMTEAKAGQFSAFACTGCGRVRYCSEKCARLDGKHHRKECQRAPEPAEISIKM